MACSACADEIFRDARSYNAWTERPVSDALLRELYDLVRWGPTSANTLPMRLIFVRTPKARDQLAGLMIESNRAKVLEAPVTVIIGYDLHFFERLHELFPHNPRMAGLFAANPVKAEESAFRNSSMQAGYLIVAARMLGLDCGPMSGFDATGVDAAFFADGRCKTNLVCCLGYGDVTRAFWERLPRLAFEDACTFC